MKLSFCVACGTKNHLHHHHLKPRVAGGTDDEKNLLTLCQECHAIYHNLNFRDHGYLTRLGLEKAKARGVKLGSPDNEKRGEEARDRAKKIFPIFLECINEGAKSYHGIACKLNDRNIPTASGKGKWWAKTVHNTFLYLDTTLKEHLND